jgi:uncharacterized protein involved in exopolysaccharide biosynthesis
MATQNVTVRALVGIAWRDRWLIAAVVISAVVISVVYAMTRKPLYESEALLAPVRGEVSQLGALSALAGQFAGLGALTGLPGMQGGDVDETVAVLKSRQFTDAFMRKHMITPHLFPELWECPN